MLPPLPALPRPEPAIVPFTPPDHPINPEQDSGFRVMLARFPGNNQEHPDSPGYYLRILPQLLEDERIAAVVPFRRSDTPIPMVRNLCVREAIAEHCDYILMIDADMNPDCEPDGLPFWETAWEFLMDRRRREFVYACDNPFAHFNSWWEPFAPAAVAAPYCGDPPFEQCYAMRWMETNGTKAADEHFRLTNVERHDAARRSGLEKAPAAPTGLILYDTRIFFYLPPPWFDYEYEDAYQSSKVTSEDIHQTRNAALLGMPVYCAWDCWAGHWKPKQVRKPAPIAMETIRGSLQDAFKKQISVLEKLHFLAR